MIRADMPYGDRFTLAVKNFGRKVVIKLTEAMPKSAKAESWLRSPRTARYVESGQPQSRSTASWVPYSINREADSGGRRKKICVIGGGIAGLSDRRAPFRESAGMVSSIGMRQTADSVSQKSANGCC